MEKIDRNFLGRKFTKKHAVIYDNENLLLSSAIVYFVFSFRTV